MQAKSFLLIFFFLSSYLVSAQQPGINLNTAEATHSYTLVDENSKTYLIDNCGMIVHDWNTFNMRHHSKLLPNGNILFIQSGVLFEINWDGDILKQLIPNDASIHLEYEVIPLANGNYLCLGRKDFSLQNFADIGYEISGGALPTEVDVVVELDKDTGVIVWEWNISDHVIQQRNANDPNYGILKDNPQLLNMDAILTYDWQEVESFMINGMDYNPELDQIILSVRKMSEIVIVDHSTTTVEAAGHTGGQSGKGGDILWRWGNPANYDSGTPDERYLYFQHNPKWITKGPHIGKISCYNNGLNRPDTPLEERYSTVPVLIPEMDSDGNYMRGENGAFLPASPALSYNGNNTNSPFFSGYTSGAEFLENGNVYITEGYRGRIFEMNSDGETVWQYTIPGAYYIFRTEKYNVNYPAFEGKDLIPSGDLPGTFSDYECMLVDAVDEVEAQLPDFDLSKKDGHRYGIYNPTERGFYYQVFNIQGTLLSTGKAETSYRVFDLNRYLSGYYLINIADAKLLQWRAFKVFNE